MSDHTVTATLIVRQGIANNWITRNPILAKGEYGLEIDTALLKIGDGIRTWINLPYLNKLDSSYFTQETDGTITFSDNFKNMLATLEASAGQTIERLQITTEPVDPYDVTNKQYVDNAIAAAGHLKRQIVQVLPSAEIADPNTLYMILAQSEDHYEEYMVVNGVWDMVGSTGDGGSGGFTLQIATTTRLGGVKASTSPDTIDVDAETGIMTLNQVSTSLLYVPTGDTLVLYGGNA